MKQYQNHEFQFCKILKGTKKPYEKDWTNKPYTWQEIQEHISRQTNFGVLCGYGGLCIIDSDTPELKKAIEKDLPETFVVKTGSGNYHYYFICNTIKNKIVLQNDEKHYGEVLSFGCQAVGVGSIHPNKNVYAIEKDLPIAEITKEQLYIAITPFMQRVIDAEKTAMREIKDYGNSDINSLSITDVMNTAGYKRASNGELYGANNWHGSTGGMNTWINTRKNLAYCFRCHTGINVAKAIALNEGIIHNCSDSLSRDEFIQVLNIAKEKYGLGERDNPYGVLPKIADKIPKEEKLSLVSANELKKLKKPKNYIVDGLIYPQDVIMNAGDSNSYKSLLSLYEAICISKGIFIFNHFRVKRCNVLILSLENSPFVDGSRITSICRGLNIQAPKNLYFISRQSNVDLQNKTFQKRLLQSIQEKSIKMIYIDTINPATPDIDDNAVRDVQKVFSILFNLVSKTNIAIKFLHHTGKDKKAYLGSVKWKANSDGLLYSDRHRDENNFPTNLVTISNEKNRWGENKNIQVRIISEKKGDEYYKTMFELISVAGQGRPAKRRVRKIDKALTRVVEILKEQPSTYSELRDIILKEKICNEKTFKSARSLGVIRGKIKLNEESQKYEVVK